MKTLSTIACALCVGVLANAHAAGQARERDQSRDQTQTMSQAQSQERVYGYELMTPIERREYQTKMRALNTEQEREAFRLEHHRLMQERARAQGKTLPDMPPAGMGPGSGMGGGMGPGYRR
jgi:hypothetical protein